MITAFVLSTILAIAPLGKEVKKHDRIPIEKDKVEAMKAVLHDEPYCFAPTYKDREKWDKAVSAKTKAVIAKRANRLINADGTSTLEAWQPDWEQKWWNVPKTNDSDTGKKMQGKRGSVLVDLAIAECVTNEGKYTKATNDALRKILRQLTWAHPRNHTIGARRDDIELNTQNFAGIVSQVLYIMDDKIEPELRQEAVDTLYAKVFNPIVETLEPVVTNRHGWLTGIYNWTPACLSGILTAALCTIQDKDLRAKIAYIADRYVDNYIVGYTDDGYCTEGMSYYNYGYDKYFVIRELLYNATGGKVDIFTRNPRLSEMMLFPMGMQLYADISPDQNFYGSFADCSPNTRPSALIMCYNTKYMGIDIPAYRNYDVHRVDSFLARSLMFMFNDYAVHGSGADGMEFDPLRSVFPYSGLATMRPAEDAPWRMAVTAKGGHTAESHNHNDVGSYSICVNGQFLTEDPGIAPYTGVTFSSKRYTIKTINSYGHPVPTVDGKLEKEGINTPAPILKSDFTDSRDVFEIEMKDFFAPYVDGISGMTRTFTYVRDGKNVKAGKKKIKVEENSPVLIVRDDYSAEGSHVWEDAITTRAEVIVSGNTISFTRKDESMVARINASAPVKITTESIGATPNEAKIPFTRISIKMEQPVDKAFIEIIYSEN